MASLVCARSSTGWGDAEHSVCWLTRRALLITWDAFGWAFALAVASSLRADFTIDDIETRPFLTIVAVAVTAQLAVHAVLRTYRGRHPIGGIDEASPSPPARRWSEWSCSWSDIFTHQQLIPHSVPLLAAPIAWWSPWGPGWRSGCTGSGATARITAAHIG